MFRGAVGRVVQYPHQRSIVLPRWRTFVEFAWKLHRHRGHPSLPTCHNIDRWAPIHSPVWWSMTYLIPGRHLADFHLVTRATRFTWRKYRRCAYTRYGLNPQICQDAKNFAVLKNAISTQSGPLNTYTKVVFRFIDSVCRFIIARLETDQFDRINGAVYYTVVDVWTGPLIETPNV